MSADKMTKRPEVMPDMSKRGGYARNTWSGYEKPYPYWLKRNDYRRASAVYYR